MAADLEQFDLEDIQVGLTEIGLRPREEGETAFPSIGTLYMGVKGARGRRKEAQRVQSEQQEHLELLKRRNEHPEEFLDDKDWEDICALAKGRMEIP